MEFMEKYPTFLKFLSDDVLELIQNNKQYVFYG